MHLFIIVTSVYDFYVPLLNLKTRMILFLFPQVKRGKGRDERNEKRRSIDERREERGNGKNKI